MLWLDRRCSVVDGFQCFELVLICSGLFSIFFLGGSCCSLRWFSMIWSGASLKQTYVT